MSHNEKFWVDQVTVPHPPPPGDRQGVGNDKGGEVLAMSVAFAYSTWDISMFTLSNQKQTGCFIFKHFRPNLTKHNQCASSNITYPYPSSIKVAP